MNVLKELEPANVFAYFEEICGIPHTSFHEKALSDYCVDFAKKHGFYYEQDDLGNVIIIKEATEGYEDAAPVMIQGHLDMVGDKTADCPLDLEKDGLILKIEGDYLTAEGTTLGGDDGIAIAYALAILDSKDIPHPRLETVFTVSEEVGLLGASSIDLSCCKAKRLLNIDSEAEGVLTVGCAGGRRTCSTIPVTRKLQNGLVYDITLTGLLGGHSGMEIHKGRANANVLMGRFLLYAKNRLSFALVSLSGGIKENVIPNKSQVSIVIDSVEEEAFLQIVNDFQKIVSVEYAAADPDIKLICSKGDIASDETTCSDEHLSNIQTVNALDEASLNKLLTALNTVPNGVQAMSMDLPGLVETSLNVGVMELTETDFTFKASIRSSVVSAKEYIYDKIALLTESLGGNASYVGDYPAWAYTRDSKLRDLCVDIFEKQYGKKPVIEIIHAGLECGILSSKIEGLDCISFGPDLLDIHTVSERMGISSVQRVWEYLKAILAAK